MTAQAPTRRDILAGESAAAPTLASSPSRAETGDPIRPLVLISKSQAVDPAQYQAAQLVMQWRKPGLKITVQVLPASQQSSAVWMTRIPDQDSGVENPGLFWCTNQVGSKPVIGSYKRVSTSCPGR